jgi:hypothetical protein
MLALVSQSRFGVGSITFSSLFRRLKQKRLLLYFTSCISQCESPFAMSAQMLLQPLHACNDHGPAQVEPVQWVAFEVSHDSGEV